MATVTLLKRTVKRCWQTHFDKGQGKADAIQENTSRKEMKSLSLQNSTRIALDEKMRDFWLIRTSALSEQEIAGIPTVTERSTGLSALKKAIQQTIVSRPREEVRDDRREREDRARDKTSSAGDNFHTRSDGEKSESETDLGSLDEQDLRYATDTNAEYEAIVGLREARRNCSMRQNRDRFHKKGDNGPERVTSNRLHTIQELKRR